MRTLKYNIWTFESGGCKNILVIFLMSDFCMDFLRTQNRRAFSLWRCVSVAEKHGVNHSEPLHQHTETRYERKRQPKEEEEVFQFARN